MAEATNPIATASNPRVGEDRVLVPREPTRDMLSTWIGRWLSSGDADFEKLLRHRYHNLIASAPALPDEIGSVEKLAAAIDAADHGYSIKLKSLTEAGSVYTLDLCDGSDLIEFSDREDAREHAERHRSLARAKAALTFLSAKNGDDQ